MDYSKNKNIIKYGKAVCYSGYRKGQSPVFDIYPSYEEVKEDLLELKKNFNYIRLYDSGKHAKTVCEVIRNEKINLKVLLGINLLGEISNPNCSWGGIYTDEELAGNIENNQNQLNEVINLANSYKEIVLGISAGNESVPEWNDNLVSPSRVLYFVKELKKRTNTLITYCDNYYYWTNILKAVAEAVDFISIHSYPVWTKTPINHAINVCINEYEKIKNLYPNKQVIITETGWPTLSDGITIPKSEANTQNQKIYNSEIDKWSEKNGVICFFFEAFDEPWKGSHLISDPEKNWGIYNCDRVKKH